MLKEEKRRELNALVGKQNADALIQNMLSREKSAQRQGIAFKALDPVTLDDINDFTDAITQSMEDEMTEKASYKKQTPAMEAAEDPNDSAAPMRTKSDGNEELVATLKAYTESQESFAAAMVDALEALDTRLKELGEAKSTFNPSATHKNVVVDKDGNMVGLTEVEQAAYRMWFQNQ